MDAHQTRRRRDGAPAQRYLPPPLEPVNPSKINTQVDWRASWETTMSTPYFKVNLIEKNEQVVQHESGSQTNEFQISSSVAQEFTTLQVLNFIQNDFKFCRFARTRKIIEDSGPHPETALCSYANFRDHYKNFSIKKIDSRTLQ